MNSRRLLAIALVSLACGGCAQVGAYVVPTTTLGRSPQVEWQEQDIPVPEGFAFLKDDSLVEEGSPRNMKLVYRREAFIDIDHAWSFYQEALTGRGWDLQFLFGFDRRGMVFTKGQEELRVTLDRSYRATCVTAVIEVEPRDPEAAGPALAQRVK